MLYPTGTEEVRDAAPGVVHAPLLATGTPPMVWTGVPAPADPV